MYGYNLGYNIVRQGALLNHTLLDGLVSIWELDETSGTTVYDKYSVNDGISTSIQLNNFFTPNLLRSYRFISAANSNVQITNKTPFVFSDGVNDKPFSVSVFGSLEANVIQGGWIINKRHEAGTNAEFQICIFSGKLIFNIFSTHEGSTINDKLEFTAPNPLPYDNTVHHFVFTYDGSKSETGLNVYYDGNLLAGNRTSNNYVGIGYTDSSLVIGKRGWEDGGRWYGKLAQVAVFDHVLNDQERRILGYQTAYNRWAEIDVDTFSNYASYSINYSELSYVILHQTGTKIFAKDITNGKLLYSSNSGSSFTEYIFTDTSKVQVGFIFQNGNLFFCTDTDVYYSSDELISINAITPLDESGNPYSPTIDKLNFSPLGTLMSQIDGSDELFVWGNYTVDVDTNINVWCSKNGTDCKIIQQFSPTSLYNARHIHSCVYYNSGGYWLIVTGDEQANDEIHILKAEYSSLTGLFTWSELLNGVSHNQTKIGVVQPVGINLYWMSDQTTGDGYLGLWKSPIDQISNLSRHKRIFSIFEECTAMYIDNDFMFFATIHDFQRTWEIYVYDFNYKIIQYFPLSLSVTPPGSGDSIYLRYPGRIYKNGTRYYLDILDLLNGYIYETIEFELI